MPRPYNIAKMSEIPAKAVTEIRRLSGNLFSKEEQLRDESISSLVTLVTQHMDMIGDKRRLAAAIAVFFDACFDSLKISGPRQQSELYKFFIILNHLPVLDNSPFYAQTLDILSHYFRRDASIIKLFDKLQLLYLYAEIGHFEAANKLAAEMESEISEKNLSFYTLYQLCKFKIYNAGTDVEAKAKVLLRLTAQIYETEGDECALFLMGRWLSSLELIKSTPFYRALLSNLYAKIKTQQSLNSAIIGFELFSLDDKLVPPEDKMKLYNDLLEFKESVLNATQLHALHFFAGNYISGKNEDFRDSIQSFKSSNYFLHKCWERLIGISRYLRMHCNPPDYKTSIGFLDRLYLDLSHQTSMRNNSYVENLQANFDKIEELYREVGELSLRDSLTGLRNRRYMENNLNQIVALSFRHNAAVSFAMIDIDFFKRVNDVYGHQAGDIVLVELGKMLSTAFRKSDIIIRYGGEEFLIVLFDLDPEKGMKMMQDLREKIEKHTFQYRHHKITITISVGLSSENLSKAADCCEIDRFVQNADTALYLAKESGRNTVVLYQEPKNPA